jgi:hypothetical protein
MRKRWADPAYRIKQIEGRKRTALDRVRYPKKYSRAQWSAEGRGSSPVGQSIDPR